MITSLRLVDFKNFADETLRVGPFTVIVGANASGKSNIRDAFRFLHGIGRGYTLAEIIGGKYGVGGQVEWKPIRGAVDEIIRFKQPAVGLEVKMKLMNEDATYYIEVAPEIKRTAGFRIVYECLRKGRKEIYEKPRDNYGNEYVVFQNSAIFHVKRDRPALSQLQDEKRKPWYFAKDFTRQVSDILHNIHFLELSPDRMREPAFPGATVLGDAGENLPGVLEDICADPKRKYVLTGWLRELTPMDVTDFKFPRDPSGRVHLQILESDGRQISAYSASDGTLRFLAMLAVLLGDNPKGLYFFEEIDTGIHPARQWLLLDLIEKQTPKCNIQVMTTTHSPDLLTYVNDSTFKHLSVVCRLNDSHDAIIRTVAKLPNAEELRTSGRGLGKLLTEGWMETALAFTENHNEAEGDRE